MNDPLKLTVVPLAKIAPLAGALMDTTGSGLVTVTVCVQVEALFNESFAVQVMVVVPKG